MKEKKSSLKQLFEFAGGFKYLTIASWLLAAISALAALVPFYYIWKVLKEVLEVRPYFENAIHIKLYGWYAVGFALLSMLIYIGALLCSHIAAFRVQANMRSRMMRHIMTLPLGMLESEGTGKIRKIVNECSAATETYLAHQLPDKAVSLATPVGLIVLLLIFDWKLGILSLIPAILGFVCMGSMMGKDMEESMKQYQNALETMSSEAVEYVRGVPVVKTFGQSVFSFKRFKKAIDDYESWTICYTKKMMKPMIGFTTAINSAFVFLIAAAYFFTQGGITDTFALNLFFYIIISPIITVVLMKMAYAGETQMVVKDALSRIDNLLDQKPLPEPEKPAKPIDGSITFKNVTFAYNGAKKNAVDGVNFKVSAGEHVAFVGPSGGGKTTLACLVARFWDVTSGSIEIGGVNVKDISSKALMQTVSYVFQDSKLLKMSILENVRMGRLDASREEVLEALEKAQCQDIIEKLPQGIDTVIGTKGIFVSGCEAQRLSIARAFLKDAPILILDEATAFADPDNEEKVQQAFANLSKDKTVIMIAHRLSTITDVNRIYVLKEGKVEEKGNHNELLEKHGLYEHMWRTYNESVKWKVGERK